jgi:transcriptional regulator of arginine metabolism
MSDDWIKSRQKAIGELVKKMAITDQKQLVGLLQKQYGIEANQAVISRDLRKLGVVKKMINGVLTYEMPDVDISAEIFRLALIDICYNESLIVIKTQPGLAAFVGDFIDQYPDLDVLGCLAGENVVFITPITIKKIQKTYEKICRKFHFKRMS